MDDFTQRRRLLRRRHDVRTAWSNLEQSQQANTHDTAQTYTPKLVGAALPHQHAVLPVFINSASSDTNED